MNSHTDKVLDEWNKISNSDWYMSYRTDEVIHNILKDPSSAFHRTTWELIQKSFPSLNGKKICVPSSGDNRAVFAFASLGAHVTSCDICEQQLKYANEIAKKNLLEIDFVVQDTMKLQDIESNEYDLVYTSEGVHVWIDDLNSMYQNIYRILKMGGVYINYEIHPFTRPFAYDDGKPDGRTIKIQKTYDITGPFDDGTTYHWRMQDLLNAVTEQGLSIKRMEEMHDEEDKGHFWFYEYERVKMTQDEIQAFYDYKKNPLAALPQWFSLYAVK